MTGAGVPGRALTDRLQILVTSMVVVTTLATTACGDGCYIQEKAYKTLPAIPSQRAIISYRDGVETMVVESSLDAEGQRFGWILPVPATPTSFAKVSPGLIKTLDLVTQPEIVHSRIEEVHSMGLLVGLVAIVLFWLVYPRRWSRRQVALLTALMLLLLFCISLPIAAKSRSAGFSKGADGVVVEKTASIGSYDVSVLKAANSSALDKWLTDSDLAPLPSDGTRIVNDYIKQGWRFVVAVIRRNDTGLSVPHPLAVTFPADRPIYPMRLTALANSSVYLDLYVIAPGRASNALLTAEFCDQYHHDQAAQVGHAGEMGTSDFRNANWPGYVGLSFGRTIGHADAVSVLWDDCVVTRLNGTLTPSAMKTDLGLAVGPIEPVRETYYSNRGALATGVIIAMRLWLLGLPLVIMVVYLGIGRDQRTRRLRQLVVGLTLACVATIAVTFIALRRIEVTVSRKLTAKVTPRLLVQMYCQDAVLILEDAGVQSQPDAITQAENAIIESGLRNVYTAQPLLVEMSPGNFTVKDTPRGILLTFYDDQGFPISMTVTRTGG